MQKIFKRLYNEPPQHIYRLLRKKLLHVRSITEFDTQNPCVFVLSTGRVGTETLAALLGLANNVFSYHEPTPKIYGLSKLGYEYFNQGFLSYSKAIYNLHVSYEEDIRKPSASESLDNYSIALKILREAFLIARGELLNFSLESNKGYVETSPQITFLAPIILELIPNVRFIHLVRDPRDVVRSGMRRKWFDGNSADETRIIPLKGSQAEINWSHFNPFQKNLWLWTQTNCWIQEFLTTVPVERKMLLHSEALFSADPTILAHLFEFISASMPPDKKVARLLGKKLNAQKSGEFPVGSVWVEELNKELVKMAGETAKLLGYKLPSVW